MKITVDHIPVETASDEDKWMITTHTENSNMLFYGEISKAVYDALKYQEQQIKELKELLGYAWSGIVTEEDEERIKQALK